MKNETKFVCALAGLLSLGGVASAQPQPVWSTTLDNAASMTSTGGTIVGSPTFPAGYSGNAFGGTGDSYAVWNNDAVANIFDGVWDNSAGSTIDLYFSGDNWSTMTGDAGLFGIYDRLDGRDGYYIIEVRNGALRIPYRNDGGDNQAVTYLDSTRLTDNVIYHLTVSQKDNELDIYLDDVNGSQLAPNTLYAKMDTTATYVFPSPNTIEGTVLASNPGGRAMTVGLKPYSTGYLQSGEWVDNISVYNGYYTPAELAAVPEPADLSLIVAGCICLLAFHRRQKTA